MPISLENNDSNWLKMVKLMFYFPPMSWWRVVSPKAKELATNELVEVSAYLSDGVRQELIINEASEKNQRKQRL